MTLEMAVDLIRMTLTTALSLVAPLLLTAIVVGVAVSLFQSITSIQEQTLTFVPKLTGVVLVGLVVANWLLRTLMEFAADMFQNLPSMVQ